MEFNREYICSLMPQISKEEKRINKQWKEIQNEIISRAKHGYNTYSCWYGHYEEIIWKLLKENSFQVYIDWTSGWVEIRW